jgi:exonuclease SbcC
VLADGVRGGLIAVTANRYVGVQVDPGTLDVQVCGPDRRWRHAGLLSHGTAEQVYLLLRVTMAQHLVSIKEVCPLLLDDVTVHCDAQRRLAVLQALHILSRERQVILFTQEESVLAWAQPTLHDPPDRIIMLHATEPLGAPC